MGRKRFYFGIIAALIVVGLGHLGGCVREGYEGVDESWRIWEETREWIPFEHKWRDNTLGVRRRMAEWRHLRDRSMLGLMEVTTQIQRSRLVERVMEFGVPEEWFDPTYRARGFSFDDEAVKRGVRLRKSRGSSVVGPDYEWIIQESIVDVRDPAKQLQRIATEVAPGSARDLIRITASFVQTIPYRVPAEYRVLPNGDRLCIFGVAVPIEVLFLKWGDCDSKSLLFASIMANFPRESVVFVRGEGHLFVGVQTAPRSGDRFVRVQGIPYVLIELTSPWPVGRVPRELWTRAKKGLYEIIPVVQPRIR
jgi:hypothetical protein